MSLIYRFCRSLFLLLGKIFFQHQVIHRERIPESQALLIASNHVSYLDPPVVGVAFRYPINFLARKSLYSNGFARWLFPHLRVVPVDQEKADVGPIKTIIRLLKQNEPVLIFPEGQRSWDGQLQSAEPGLGFIVAKTGAPVLPVRVYGAHEALPRGGNQVRIGAVTVVVGEVLRFPKEELSGGKDAYQKISDRVMNAIAQLECPPDRQPRRRE